MVPVVQPITIAIVVSDINIVAGECPEAVEDSEGVLAGEEAKHARQEGEIVDKLVAADKLQEGKAA
jgi:hypothetical protein